jgi:hypothetical protein
MPYSWMQTTPIARLDFPEVEEKLNTAIALFKEKDPDLLSFDRTSLPERPVSHRLGFYMDSLFKGYNVDCEYNKRLQGAKKKWKAPIIPDILVHRRKTDNNNLLVVEVKAGTRISKSKSIQGRIKNDFEKLEFLTSQEGGYHYDYGAFTLILRDETVVLWFEKESLMQRSKVKAAELVDQVSLTQ